MELKNSGRLRRRLGLHLLPDAWMKVADARQYMPLATEFSGFLCFLDETTFEWFPDSLISSMTWISVNLLSQHVYTQAPLIGPPPPPGYSAEYAIILLALNSRSRLSISGIEAETGAAKDETDSKIHELMSKRGSDVWVQVEATARRGKICIPFVRQGGSVPDDPKRKAAVVSNQDSQVDTAVVLVLKTEKAMDREALREIVRPQLIGVEDAAFDAGLAKLQSQEFIRIEPSGRVHSLP
jgi:hypothetical protein